MLRSGRSRLGVYDRLKPIRADPDACTQGKVPTVVKCEISLHRFEFLG